MSVTTEDGCTITAKADSCGIVMKIVRNDPEGDVEVGTVIVESFNKKQQVHIFLGDNEDQPDQTIVLPK